MGKFKQISIDVENGDVEAPEYNDCDHDAHLFDSDYDKCPECGEEFSVLDERRSNPRLSDELREHHDKLFTLIRALQEENSLLRGQLATERAERILLHQAHKILGI